MIGDWWVYLSFATDTIRCLDPKPATGWQHPAMAAAKVFPPKSCRDFLTPWPSAGVIHGSKLWWKNNPHHLGYKILSWIIKNHGSSSNWICKTNWNHGF